MNLFRGGIALRGFVRRSRPRSITCLCTARRKVRYVLDEVTLGRLVDLLDVAKAVLSDTRHSFLSCLCAAADDHGMEDQVLKNDVSKVVINQRQARQIRSELVNAALYFHRFGCRKEVRKDGVEDRGGDMVERPGAGRSIRSDHGRLN